jgi:F-type H+-transporting ATPase subunit b
MNHVPSSTSSYAATFLSKLSTLSTRLKPLAVVLLGCVYSSVALASGDEHAGDDQALRDTLYQALNLALLLGVLIYFGRKPIAEFFETRREGIASELNDAAELLRQAEQRNSELQSRLVALGSEVDGIREDAGRRAEEEAERILAGARATADRIRRDAHAAVAQELRRAQTLLHDEAADLAMEIAARKLTEQVSDADRDRLVDEFILRIEPSTTTSGTTPGTAPSTEGTSR